MMLSLLIPTMIGPVPRDIRLTKIFLVCRLSNGSRDDLCRVRDISADGMRIETFALVRIGQQVSIDLKNGVTVCAEVVWVGDAEAGVHFDTPIDVEKMLAPAERSLRNAGARVMRSPRLSVRSLVAVRRNGRIMTCVMTDISQGGARMRSAEATAVGDQIVLLIPRLGSPHGAVRWQRDGVLGLSFAEKIGFAQLARWLASPDASRRDLPSRSAGTAETLDKRAGNQRPAIDQYEEDDFHR